jgi:hypothetical protein
MIQLGEPGVEVGLNPASDPDDLIYAAPALVAKGAAAVGATIPFTSIVERMLGPSAWRGVGE